MMLTPEREKEIREAFSDEHHLPLTIHMTVKDLLKEIDRLRAENIADLTGQEHRLGSEIDTLIHNRDMAFNMTRKVLEVNERLRTRIAALENTLAEKK